MSKSWRGTSDRSPAAARKQKAKRKPKAPAAPAALIGSCNTLAPSPNGTRVIHPGGESRAGNWYQAWSRECSQLWVLVRRCTKRIERRLCFRFTIKTSPSPDPPHPPSIRSVPRFQVPALHLLWTADSSVHLISRFPPLKKSAQPRQNVVNKLPVLRGQVS